MKWILAIALLAASFSASAVLVCANDTYGEHGSWHVGEPTTQLDQVDLADDVWCEASGAELAYVQHNFSGLRARLGKSVASVMWSGDDAIFILANL